MEKVFYGNTNGGIEEVTAVKGLNGNEVIYATDNEIMGLILTDTGFGDLDTVRVVLDGKVVLVERREGVFNKLYNKEGFVYELDGTTFKHDNNLREYEVISSEKTLKPLNVVNHQNVLEELKKLASEGKLELYEYPNRPEEIPADNKDLIDKYIFYFNNGATNAMNDLLDVYPEFTDEVRSRINFITHEDE